MDEEQVWLVSWFFLVFFLNREFSGNGNWGGTEDIHKFTLKFCGLEKRWEKISGEKMKHFPATFSSQVQNVNRFPWIFQNMTFVFENYVLSLKKKYPCVQRKGSKGRSEMPSEGNKTSN